MVDREDCVGRKVLFRCVYRGGYGLSWRGRVFWRGG